MRSKSVKETQKIAAELAEKIINLQSDKPTVIALEGELGAGKTVFVKAFAKTLGVKDKIKSPTFVLIKKYQVPKTDKILYHLDCYRLKDENDLNALGIHDIFKESHSIVAIEWSDRVQKILPKKHIKIHIDHISNKERRISILI